MVNALERFAHRTDLSHVEIDFDGAANFDARNYFFTRVITLQLVKSLEQSFVVKIAQG